jgi:hypothetical protein
MGIPRLVAAGVLLAAFAAPADAQDFRHIHNRWKPELFVNIEQGPPVAGAIDPAWHSAMWVLEPVEGTEFHRIRSRWKGTYLHVEHGPVESGDVDPGWWSAMWTLEPVAGTEFHRIRNRWKETYLHVEHGALELGAADAGWWSAMWTLESAGEGGGGNAGGGQGGNGTGNLRSEGGNGIVEERAAPIFVWVKTGTPDGAGTDAPIILEVQGRHLTTGALTSTRGVELDGPGNDFENGSEAKYRIDGYFPSAFGEIVAIRLENSGQSGPSALTGEDWYVEYVCVAVNFEDWCHQDWRIPVNRWIPGHSATMWITK